MKDDIDTPPLPKTKNNKLKKNIVPKGIKTEVLVPT
jgi:hypothetical protein